MKGMPALSAVVRVSCILGLGLKPNSACNGGGNQLLGKNLGSAKTLF